MGLARSLFLGVMIAYVVHVYMTVCIPHGVTESTQLKVALMGTKMSFHLSWLLDYVGVVDDFKVRRFSIDQSTYLTNIRIEGVQTEDAIFDGVPVRVYTPAGSVKNGPGMMFYHGGGWIVGNIDSYDSIAAFMAREANMVIISVEYRLNPEHSQKDGLEDCLTSTRFFLSNAQRYHVDSARVGVSGDSAGGNYAAVVALHLRDEDFKPALKLQVLIYPSVQAIDLMLPSYQQNAAGPFIDKYDMCWSKSYISFKSNKYLHHFMTNSHVSSDVRIAMATGALNHNILPEVNKYGPYMSPEQLQGHGGSEIWDEVKTRFLDPDYYPLMADNHADLPETYIFTGQFDLLRDDGYLYAHKLGKDGTKVTHYNCLYCWHAMFNFMHLQHPKDMLTEIMAFARETL